MPDRRNILPQSGISFAGSAPAVVRSIRHRDLLNRWLKLYGVRQEPPTFDEYAPEVATADRTMIIFFTVIWDGEEKTKILVESSGTIGGEMYATVGKNRELMEVLGPDRAPLVIPIYDECIHRRLPVYTISEVTDDYGRKVDVERLLLPLCEDGHVTRLVGALETISIDGRFEARGLLSDHTPVDTLRVVIDKDLFFEPPPHIPPSMRIEFE